MNPTQIIILCILITGATVLSIIVLKPWVKAWSSGVYMSIIEIIFLKFRGTPPNLLIEVAMTLKHSGQEYSYEELEVIYIAEKFSISSPKELFEKYNEAKKKTS